MSLHEWPEQERPREKLLFKGPEALSDAEVLAILLRSGSQGESVVELARRLLKEFGSLNELLKLSKEKVCQIRGMGEAKYTQLQAALELNRRVLFEPLQQQEILNNTQQTKQYLVSKLGHQTEEVFAALFLNNKNRIIAFKELFRGSINQTEVYPREVVKMALAFHAAAVILVHNHPSGDLIPSDADIELTRRLTQALELVDVRVLDHIIVGGNRAGSI